MVQPTNVLLTLKIWEYAPPGLLLVVSCSYFVFSILPTITSSSAFPPAELSTPGHTKKPYAPASILKFYDFKSYGLPGDALLILVAGIDRKGIHNDH
jgi:hypothetical protein